MFKTIYCCINKCAHITVCSSTCSTASFSSQLLASPFNAVIDRSGFFALLQDQKLLQNKKQNLLPDSEASVQAEAPVQTGAPVSAESYIMTF